MSSGSVQKNEMMDTSGQEEDPGDLGGTIAWFPLSSTGRCGSVPFVTVRCIQENVSTPSWTLSGQAGLNRIC